ncbi:ricin-type beta-trefoil lectin domain protein [Actinoplanes sp. M2I2]|uniref:ricin-type beta-trefoil lectin domain protein n=1 Tax=Actinoplanes sp. M2I2 TaxID=1734444 RepID=UPI00202293DE|nr:ricin-type beta-trefoil lectin domain protein [Actinoplanes sp. M2I2]
MADDEKREDPVLVRPYVRAVAEAERAPDEEPETWPETAPLPVEEDDTLAHPAVEDQPPPAPKKPRLTLHPLARAGIFAGGVLVALGVVGYLIFGPAADPELPQPGVALPAAPGQAPLDQIRSAAPSGTTSASGSASVSPSASVSVPASAGASLQPLVPVAPSGSVPVAPGPAPTATPTATSAVPTTDPTLAPPASDRTGKITAASGRCLARGGLLGGNGAPVQVNSCLSVSAQTFTLATDGTLKVGSKCARSTGDGTVRIGACGDDDAGQWRSGPGGTLVNSSGGGCLTDPGRVGGTTTVTSCSGDSAQNWSLP